MKKIVTLRLSQVDNNLTSFVNNINIEDATRALNDTEYRITNEISSTSIHNGYLYVHIVAKKIIPEKIAWSGAKPR